MGVAHGPLGLFWILNVLPIFLAITLGPQYLGVLVRLPEA